jgi:hypothetical protein
MSYQLRKRNVEINNYTEKRKYIRKNRPVIDDGASTRASTRNNKDDTSASESTVDLKFNENEVQNSLSAMSANVSDDNKNNQTYELEGESIFDMTERELDHSILQRDTFFNQIVEDDCSSNRSSDTDDSDDSLILNDVDYYDERAFEDDMRGIDGMLENINLNSDNISELQFSTTSRGGRKLLCDGYSYVRDRGDYELTQWKCNFSVRVIRANKKAVSVYCPGRCHTFNDKSMKIITHHQSSVGGKLHFPDPALIETFVSLEEAKIMAKNTTENPRSIIKKSQLGLSTEAAAKMKRHHNIRYMINKIRSHKPTYGPNPANLSLLTVPPPLRFTHNNELFLLCDSGYGDEERVFIFATENNLKLLQDADEWYADGTFEVAPLLYKQMYNIAGEISGKILPLLYSLLPNKTEKIYLKLFDLINKFPDFRPPNNATLDFEKLV